MKMTGEELRRIRKGLRLNQDMWSELTGVFRSTVSDWENEKAAVPVLTARVARYLDSNPLRLYEFMPELKDMMKDGVSKKTKRATASKEEKGMKE